MLPRRLSRAIDAGRLAVRESAGNPAPEARGPAQLVSWALVDFDGGSDLEAHLVAHRTHCRSKGVRCLVVSDSFPSTLIAEPDITFEFVPADLQPAGDSTGGMRIATDYAFRRLSLIVSFWNVIGCTWVGEKAADLLDSAPRNAHAIVRMSRLARVTNHF